MARTAKGGLSQHPTKGFRITIGKKPDGKPRLFWLGHKRGLAEYHASTLRGQFALMKEQGRDVWAEKDLSAVKWVVGYFERSRNEAWAEHAAKAQAATEDQGSLEEDAQEIRRLFGDDALAATPAVESAPATDNAPATTATLYAAIKTYVAHMKGKRKSEWHKARAAAVVETNLKAVRPDCPLSAIDYTWLDSLCDHFKARPKNMKDGKPLTPAGVANILRYLRLFFVWMDDTEYGGWQAPRKLLKPFRVRQDDLMTPVELREAGTIKQFDVPTLVKLYRAGNDRQRVILLTALFTGATQQELAVLERAEFDLDKGILKHYRNKTKVEGQFWLPPELVGLLRKQFATRRKDNLAFRTADGNPLVTFRDGRQTSDAVRQLWDDLKETAELPDALSFKYVRKFVGDWMTKAGGEEMGQIALSHSRKTVLGKHYTSHRDYAGLHKLQKKLHKELAAAGMFKG